MTDIVEPSLAHSIELRTSLVAELLKRDAELASLQAENERLRKELTHAHNLLTKWSDANKEMEAKLATLESVLVAANAALQRATNG